MEFHCVDWVKLQSVLAFLLPSFLVAISWCCELCFFNLHYVSYPAWQVTACGDPLSSNQDCSPLSSHHTSAEILQNPQSSLGALACEVLDKNIVVTSILLSFAFVSLGFYHIFTNMLRIHLFFLVWQQKHCWSLKSHSLSLDFHNYKHMGKKPACLLFLLQKTNHEKNSMTCSEICTTM